MTVRELLDHIAADTSIDIEDAEGNLLTSGTASDLDNKYADYDVGYFTPTMFRHNGVWIAALTIRI